MAGRGGVPGGPMSARTGMRPMMRTRSGEHGVLGSGAGVQMEGVRPSDFSGFSRVYSIGVFGDMFGYSIVGLRGVWHDL